MMIQVHSWKRDDDTGLEYPDEYTDLRPLDLKRALATMDAEPAFPLPALSPEAEARWQANEAQRRKQLIQWIEEAR